MESSLNRFVVEIVNDVDVEKCSNPIRHIRRVDLWVLELLRARHVRWQHVHIDRRPRARPDTQDNGKRSYRSPRHDRIRGGANGDWGHRLSHTEGRGTEAQNVGAVRLDSFWIHQGRWAGVALEPLDKALGTAAVSFEERAADERRKVPDESCNTGGIALSLGLHATCWLTCDLLSCAFSVLDSLGAHLFSCFLER